MEDETMPQYVEKERTVDAAWIFDVDGVITSLQGKKVTEPQILDHIAKKPEAGEPVAFNTGRSWSIYTVGD